MSTDPWGQEIEDGSTGYHGIFAINRPLDADQPKSNIELNRFILIRIANKEYLLDIDIIREIVMLQRITHVPNAPQYVEGVINLRGTILPVLNLAKMLGESRAEATANTRILICEEKSHSVKTGLLIDGISVVRSLAKEDIDASATPLSASGLDVMEAMSKQGKNLIGILSLSKIISIAADGRDLSGNISQSIED